MQLSVQFKNRAGEVLHDPRYPYRLDFGVRAGSEAEILQNLIVLFLTPKFSQMLDRDLGLDLTLVDKPMPVAQNMLVSEIMQATQQFEPRVRIEDVSFPAGMSDPVVGNLFASITISFLTAR
jgi:phage baseplate assembly protein W